MISSSERETVGPIRFLVDYLSCLISPVPVPCFRTATVLINPRRACAARVTVVVPCVCVCVFPRPSSATRATKRQTRHTGDLSIVFASV